MDNEEPTKMEFKFLHKITDGFSTERIIGHGTFGVVYRVSCHTSLFHERQICALLNTRTYFCVLIPISNVLYFMDNNIIVILMSIREWQKMGKKSL